MTEHAARKRELERQETDLGFDRFGLADAMSLGQWLIDEAPAPVAVAVKVAGRTLFAAAHDEASLENERLAALKLAVVERFGRSSLWWFHHLQTQDRTSARDVPWLDPREYCHFGGGVPIRIAGLSLGGAAVSGLPHEEDHALVVAGLEHLLRQEASQ